MGKDEKKEAERQRCLRLKRKNELTRYKAFYAYAQRKNLGLIEAFEEEQQRSKIMDSSMAPADFTCCLEQNIEAATATNFEAPILESEYLSNDQTTEAATAANFEAPMLEPEDALKTTIIKPPTMGLDAVDIDGIVAELFGIDF